MKIEFKNKLKINNRDVNCSLDLRNGCLTHLRGPNGSGKSSFIQFLKLHQSEFFNNINIRFVDQFPLQPLNDINYYDCKKSLGSFRQEELNFYSHLEVEFSSFLNEPINSLSGGQKQIAKILLGLYLSGDIFVFDEPLQYLDDETVTTFLDLLKELKKLNKAILIIEHRKELIQDIVDYEAQLIIEDEILIRG